MRILLFILLLLASTLYTQTDEPPVDEGLTVEDATQSTRINELGVETLVVEGALVNNGDAAYSNINLYAEMYDADDALVGEGIGYLVNACGVGLLPEFVLQPGESQGFAINLELYEEGAEYERYEIIPEAAAIEADEPPDDVVINPIEPISSSEVVSVEWIDDETLRYGVGCDADVFTELRWYQFSAGSGVSVRIEHPNAAYVTEAMLRQTGLDEPVLYQYSRLSYHPQDSRIVYQNDLNTVLTAERDGSFKRLLYDDLARVSLHGFSWLPEGRFLAYYYGAYGDPVRYFTASTLGQRISASVYDVVPSQTLPGVTPDGARVVIGTTINSKTGYFLTSTTSGQSELLFASELPGNNYPAPVYVARGADEGGDLIYVVRDDTAELVCFSMESRNLNTLTPLPLALTSDDRAWTWLSPDGTIMALAANGQTGGLWLIDLAELPECA